MQRLESALAFHCPKPLNFAKQGIFSVAAAVLALNQ
jgi:hypothetical protein